MGAGAVSGACSGSKSTDIVVLAVHINTPESLTEIILGLELPALETLSAISLLRSNFGLFSHMKTAVEAVIYLRVKYHKNCLKKLKDLNAVYLPEVDLNILGQFLCKILFGKASVDKYRSIINEASLRHYDPQRILENVKIHEDSKLILKEVRELWLNFSSWSPEFAVHLTAVGVLSELVQNIGSLVDSHGVISKFSQSYDTDFGIVYNIAKLRNQPKAIRQSGVVDVMERMVKLEDGSILTLMALVTLSLITDRIETRLLTACDSVLQLLIFITNIALKTDKRQFNRFSVEELLIALRELSRNVDFKKELVKKEILVTVRRALTSTKLAEVEAALKLLAVLASDKENHKKIEEDKELMKLVTDLSLHKNAGIVNSAKQVLWEINKDRAQVQGAKLVRKVVIKQHIMMSYNSKHRDSVIKVRAALDGKNYKTWMDVSDMRGSSLEKMSEAVENAAAVLICMSPAYKESPYCKLEAEYAFMQKVPTIFLLMETGYQPDGWLGLLLGAKIFYDFSGKYDFDSKLSELMKEIKETCGEHIPRQNSPPAKPVKAPDVRPAQPQPVLTSEPVPQTVAAKMKTRDPLGQIIEKTMQADAEEVNKMDISNIDGTVIVLDEVPETPDSHKNQTKLATVANTVKKANKAVAFMSRPATLSAKSKENNAKSALVPFIAEEQRRFLSEITPIASNYHYKFLMSGKVTSDSLKIQDSVEISLDSQYCNRHGIYNCVKCGLSKVTPYAIPQSGKRRKSVR